MKSEVRSLCLQTQDQTLQDASVTPRADPWHRTFTCPSHLDFPPLAYAQIESAASVEGLC